MPASRLLVARRSGVVSWLLSLGGVHGEPPMRVALENTTSRSLRAATGKIRWSTQTHRFASDRAGRVAPGPKSTLHESLHEFSPCGYARTHHATPRVGVPACHIPSLLRTFSLWLPDANSGATRGVDLRILMNLSVVAASFSPPFLGVVVMLRFFAQPRDEQFESPILRHQGRSQRAVAPTRRRWFLHSQPRRRLALARSAEGAAHHPARQPVRRRSPSRPQVACERASAQGRAQLSHLP